MRFCIPVITLMLASALSYSAMAQTDNENITRCNDSDVDACTALIDSGKEPPAVLAIAYLKRGAIVDAMDKENGQKAINDLEKTFQLMPASLTSEEKEVYYDGYKALRLDYFFNGQRDQSITLDEKATKLWPDKTEPYVNLAEDYKSAGQYDKEFAAYSEAIRIKPNDAWLYGARGRLYLIQPTPETNDEEKIKQSLSDIDKSIQLGGTDIHDYLVRAELYEKLGEYDNAIVDYSTLIKLDAANTHEYKHRDDYLNYLKRGEAYYTLKHYDKALADIKKAQSLQPADESTFHYDLGNIYSQTGQYDKAIPEYSVGLTLAIRGGQETKQLYNSRSKAYYNTGQYDKVIDDATKAISYHSDGRPLAESFYMRGNAKLHTGDNTGAAADLAKAKQLGFAEPSE